MLQKSAGAKSWKCRTQRLMSARSPEFFNKYETAHKLFLTYSLVPHY